MIFFFLSFFWLFSSMVFLLGFQIQLLLFRSQSIRNALFHGYLHFVRPVLPGILHPEDAQLAVAAGAKGVIVSNHGGRQQDSVPAAIQVLESVVEAVRDRGRFHVPYSSKRLPSTYDTMPDLMKFGIHNLGCKKIL